MEAFLVIVPLGGMVVAVVCGLKGKWWCAAAAAVSLLVVPATVIGALIASDPDLTPYQLVWLAGGGMMLAAVAGAVRLAKPGSRWAVSRYPDRKMLLTHRRFDRPDRAGSHS